ncbi:hypothetical protein GCM10010216_05390 [Streptomyces flaveolus]|nr:hypothetical protein GCM10010216_05390 [Streptomyces flaveolus]
MVLLGLRDDVAVTEVQTEQIGVGDLVERAARAHGAIGGLPINLAACSAILAAPPADCPPRDTELLRDETVRSALTHECDSLCADRRVVLLHGVTLRC